MNKKEITIAKLNRELEEVRFQIKQTTSSMGKRDLHKKLNKIIKRIGEIDHEESKGFRIF